MSCPTRVHLAGGDKAGWALDEELRMVREALSALPDLIELSKLDSAEVVHCLNPLMLQDMDQQELVGKRILSHVPGDPLWFIQQPEFLHVGPMIGLWIAQSTKAQSALAALGYPTQFVPYALDTDVFTPRLADGQTTTTSSRERWSIPLDKYVIGNFMRDSLGEDLSQPKPQKGPDLFLAIMQVLKQRQVPVHVLLAGPRRHWLRSRLASAGISFTFVGKETQSDDYPANILDRATLNLLYHAADLHLVSSRSEGGPFAILEAAGARSKVLSTPVGLAPDILEPYCLYHTFDEAASLIARDVRDGCLAASVAVHYERILRNHTISANTLRFKELYRRIEQVPVHALQSLTPSGQHKPLLAKIRPRLVGMVQHSPRLVNVLKRVSRKMARPAAAKRHGLGITVSLWHEFREPPYGGGNQFMLALRTAFEKMGVVVYDNRMASDVDVHICNSVWFNAKQFMAAARKGGLRMLHRVDGPISLVRGSDRDLDDQVFELNAKLAAATVIQSGWCFRRLLEMGLKPVRPILITNSVNGDIFHARGRTPFDPHRKIKLISASWSDNPRKGGPIYKWLDEHLDWSRFEYTFVGRTQERFTHIKHIDAVPSEELADLLRDHDIYVTASERDPCSNSLVEALACRLPALYLNDGGHPEIVGLGGLPFEKREEIPAHLERLIAEYGLFQSLICVPTIDEIAMTYLQVIKQLLDIIPSPGQPNRAG